MGTITVYNRQNESHENDPYNFPIYRPSILGNPFTHIKDKKTKATFICSSREESIERYNSYFDSMYSSNKEFTNKVNEIYNAYKSGHNVYLECYCHPQPCHGDIIKEKVVKMLIKEKAKQFLNGKTLQ